MYDDDVTTCELLIKCSELVDWALATFKMLPPACPYEVDTDWWVFSLFQEDAREDVLRCQRDILNWMESWAESFGNIRDQEGSIASITEMAEVLLRCCQLVGDGLRPSAQPGEYVTCFEEYSTCLDKLIAMRDSIWLDCDSQDVMVRALRTHRDSLTPPSKDDLSPVEQKLEMLNSFLLEQSKPVKGLVLANEIKVAHSTFRKSYAPRLIEEYDVRNDGGGYYSLKAAMNGAIGGMSTGVGSDWLDEF